MIKLSRCEELSRAGFTKLVNGDKFRVIMKLSRCDAKIVTSFLLIPAVRCSCFLFNYLVGGRGIISLDLLSNTKIESDCSITLFIKLFRYSEM